MSSTWAIAEYTIETFLVGYAGACYNIKVETHVNYIQKASEHQVEITAEEGLSEQFSFMFIIYGLNVILVGLNFIFDCFIRKDWRNFSVARIKLL